MIEKVNPSHPDKLADRIAGALVDLAYLKQENPKIAIEILLGHNNCFIIAETSVVISEDEVKNIVERIVGKVQIKFVQVEQDVNLSKNQNNNIKAGDNGIFKGVPLDSEVKELSNISRLIYKHFPTDGKYILDKENNKLIICQSNATNEKIISLFGNNYNLVVNPIGEWSGGFNVDTGAVNRKLGSDMGRAVTGGGLHGKDLSKADVAVNIYSHLKAQKLNKEVNICCAIGDDLIDGLPYSEIVEIARDYINRLGGFEKLAEWGLV